jgi:hypothetical protein
MASERIVDSKGLYGWLDKRFPITPLLKKPFGRVLRTQKF